MANLGWCHPIIKGQNGRMDDLRRQQTCGRQQTLSARRAVDALALVDVHLTGRSHCHFVRPFSKFIPDSLKYLVALCLTTSSLSLYPRISITSSISRISWAIEWIDAAVSGAVSFAARSSVCGVS